MNVKKTAITIELDADDLRHLVAGGTTTVSDTDSEMQAMVKCTDALEFEAYIPEDEDGGGGR